MAQLRKECQVPDEEIARHASGTELVCCTFLYSCQYLAVYGCLPALRSDVSMGLQRVCTGTGKAVGQMLCWGPLQLGVAPSSSPPEAPQHASKTDAVAPSISMRISPRMACMLSRISFAAEDDEEALEDDQPVKKKRKPDKVRSSTPGCMGHNICWLAMQ